MKRKTFHRMRTLGFIGIALLLLLLSFSADFGLFKASALSAATEQGTNQQYQPSAPNEPQNEYPVMKPSRETRQKWIDKYNRAPKVQASDRPQGRLAQAPSGSLNLLSHLQYTPSERNQGSCGNCWVWGGTGVMEIALDVQKGIKDRLSIQYLNSNYNGGSGSNWACCGGWLDDLANFYAAKGRAIPWSNTNASYGDGSRTCGSSTSMPAATISTSPYYPITSITTQTITTQGVSQTTAIANIKSVLDQNKAVWFGFFMPTAADWSNFTTFWSTQGESAIWDPNFSCGHTADDIAGPFGHSPICVGYDDTAPTPYWLMLNSWGPTAGRPNGLFRLEMNNMNYSCTFHDQGINYYSFYWQTLNIIFGDPVTASQKLIGADDGSAGSTGASWFLLDRWTATDTGNISEVRIRCGGSGNVKVAVYADNNGEPGTRLRAVNTSTPVISGWNSIPITPLAVTSGTNYWLASTTDSNIVDWQNSSNRQRRAAQVTYSTFSLPDPANVSTTNYPLYYNLLAGYGNTGAPTPTTPTVTDSTGASNITSTAARLNGELTSNGNADTTVHVYWGDNDGGTTPPGQPGGWDNDINLGVKSVGTFYTDISSLSPSTPYYYRCSATNSAGTGWASSTSSFNTLAGGSTQKLIGADDGSAGSSGAGWFLLDRWTATDTGNISEVRIRCGGSGNVKVAVYADNNGEPGTRLRAVDTSTPVTSGWNSIPITPLAVTSGANYWLAYTTDSNIVDWQNSSNRQRRATQATYSTFSFPDPANVSTTNYPLYYNLLAGYGNTATPTPPLAPSLLSPGTTITFKWGAAAGATTYHLQVNTSSSFDGTSKFDADVGNNTTQEVTGLSLGTVYYWRVRAGNAAGWGDWSTKRSVLSATVP